jgi:hypothetical protein
MRVKELKFTGVKFKFTTLQSGLLAGKIALLQGYLAVIASTTLELVAKLRDVNRKSNTRELSRIFLE